MKSVRRSVISITVTGVLTGTALAALADTAKGKPFEGAKSVFGHEKFNRTIDLG
jgi:hypothetical protein